MASSRIAIALAATFFASNASVWPNLNTNSGASKDIAPAASSPFSERRAEPLSWPPPGVVALSEDSAHSEAASLPAARMERTSTGAHRLVLEKKGAFVHVAYHQAVSAGPDWAAIELRAGERAPERDVLVWESTEPETLETRRGLVSFSLAPGAKLEVRPAAAPKAGPSSAAGARACQSHDDGASGFVVTCRVGQGPHTVRAIRPTAEKPLSGAWVWDVPGRPKGKALRLVRLDLPLAPGGADVGALSFVHGGKGVVVRADATWASAKEEPALTFTEMSRSQPVSSFFSWR